MAKYTITGGKVKRGSPKKQEVFHGVKVTKHRGLPKKNVVPLPILMNRLTELANLVDKRKGKTPKGKMPFKILKKRLDKLAGVVASRI